jgi:N-acetyl-gamma-glutamylphosphate reductase
MMNFTLWGERFTQALAKEMKWSLADAENHFRQSIDTYRDWYGDGRSPEEAAKDDAYAIGISQ